AGQRAGKGALRRDAERGRRVVERHNELQEVGPLAAALDSERPLSRCGEALFRREQRRDAMREPETLESRRGKYHGIVLPVVQLSHPRAAVATQRLDAQAGVTGAQLALPPQA